jgi:hypothetical protein
MANEPDKQPHEDPAAPLLKVLPKWLVIIFAVIAFLLTSFLFALGLFWPDRLDNPTARFMMCLAVSLYLAVFLFVLYPWKYRLTKVPWIDWAVDLAGPVVVFLVLLGVLIKVTPEAREGRLFILQEEDGAAIEMPYTVLILQPTKPSQFEYYVLPTSRENHVLAGIYVEFPPGVHGPFEAKITSDYLETKHLVFERGSGKGALIVKRRKTMP